MFAAMPVKRMDELVVSQAPALFQLDRDALAINIAACIGDYLSFIGLPDCMSEKTTIEVAMMMIDTHRNLGVDAIKSFFYECKRGTYGFHYNKMDGTRLLMWFDEFVREYYNQIDDAEYAKHMSTKGDLASPISVEDDDSIPFNLTRAYAAFLGKSQEEIERSNRVKEIRLEVQRKYVNLYNTKPVAEVDKMMDDAITERLKAEGLIGF